MGNALSILVSKMLRKGLRLWQERGGETKGGSPRQGEGGRRTQTTNANFIDKNTRNRNGLRGNGPLLEGVSDDVVLKSRNTLFVKNVKFDEWRRWLDFRESDLENANRVIKVQLQSGKEHLQNHMKQKKTLIIFGQKIGPKGCSNLGIDKKAEC